jgi:hypothetical protein
MVEFLEGCPEKVSSLNGKVIPELFSEIAALTSNKEVICEKSAELDRSVWQRISRKIS